MYLTTVEKNKLFSKYGTSTQDTGNIKSQIAIFTYRIKYLSDYLKDHKKDFNTERSLIKIVGKRRKLLRYLKKKNLNEYKEIIKNLSIRK